MVFLSTEWRTVTYFENRKLLKPMLEDGVSVAHLINGHGTDSIKSSLLFSFL